MKNVTLKMPEDLLEKSREYARKQGLTLSQLIRDLLKRSTQQEEKSAAELLIEHSEKNSVSVGYKWNREDAYEK